MKKITILFICCGISLAGIAQNVGIGTPTPNASALLELQTTNKGLLLPRVADTNAVPNPAKGLLIFSNASNSVWFYNGGYWQAANSSAANNDNIWQATGDSAATTNRKYISINPLVDVETPFMQGLSVDGSLLVQQKVTATKAAPTAAQTVTMNNSPTIFDLTYDSTGRIFDPGGPNNNYINNVQGNNIITGNSVNLSFNAADFGIAAGDTLWISFYPFPACRTNYIKRFTNITTAPAAFNIGRGNIYFVFRSNGDNLNSKGFDITFKRLYPVDTVTDFTPSNAGKMLYFNVNSGAFRVGRNIGIIGNFSTASGNTNTTSGDNSTALGYENTASGFASIALGGRNIASELYSTAFGYGNYASGQFSTAFGYNSNASALGSVAMGYETNTMGVNSTAMGSHTKALSYKSTAIGSFNDPFTGSNSDSWVDTDPLLYIGNGQRLITEGSNAMVVYKNANVDINGYTRLGKLSEGTPKIKMKELIVTSAATSTGQSPINHGIDASKIISVTTLLEWNTGYLAPPEYSSDPLLRYNYFVTPTQIVIQNNAATCAYICTKTVKILITYKE